MKRILSFISVLLVTAIFAAAQSSIPKIQFNQNSSSDDDDGDAYEEGGDFIDYGMTMPGDQYIKISLGFDSPLNFPTLMDSLKGDGNLKIGGIGTIGYHNFLTSKIALGIELGFSFNMTIGGHSLNAVPILFSGSYEPSIGKFSFPITLGIGLAWESYNSKNYFPGLVVKPQVGAHYRLTDSWSLGLESSYIFMPQFNAIYDNTKTNKFGHHWTLDVVARYMF